MELKGSVPEGPSTFILLQEHCWNPRILTCFSSTQVGPMWNITGSVVGAKQNVILSAPGPATIHVPYNLTVTGPGALNAVYTWEWNTTDTTTANSGAQTVSSP